MTLTPIEESIFHSTTQCQTTVEEEENENSTQKVSAVLVSFRAVDGKAEHDQYIDLSNQVTLAPIAITIVTPSSERARTRALWSVVIRMGSLRSEFRCRGR